MAQAMEVEVFDAELAHALALVGERARLDVFAVRLRAEEVEALSWSWIAFLKTDNLVDGAALEILCRNEAVVEVVLPVLDFIGRLLALPVLEEGEDDGGIEREFSIAGFRLDIAEVMAAVMSCHTQALKLAADGEDALLRVAVRPEQAERLADARAEVEPDDERHVECVAERIPLEDGGELLVLDASAWPAAAYGRVFLARHFDEACGILTQHLHRPDGVVERRLQVVQHAVDSLKGISVLALLLHELVDERRRQGRETVRTEGRLQMQPDVLLAHFERIVAAGKLCPLVPEIEKVSKAHVLRPFRFPSRLVGVERLSPSFERGLLRLETAFLDELPLAIDALFLKTVTPCRAALAGVDARD